MASPQVDAQLCSLHLMCIIPELLAPDVHEPRIAFVGLSTSQITAGMLAGFLLQLSYFGTYLHDRFSDCSAPPASTSHPKPPVMSFLSCTQRIRL
ncbi:hypothetical protein ABBQ32_007129 [Trebouxia sp. C0010 RCD-2024]